MTISEPSTLVTDYLLGGLTGVLAWRLFQQNRVWRQIAIRFWAAALAAAAVGSLVGGTYHGFGPAQGPSSASAMWTATTLAMGAASFLSYGVCYRGGIHRRHAPCAAGRRGEQACSVFVVDADS